jgi:peptide/nickel transport system substrate-binding protein
MHLGKRFRAIALASVSLFVIASCGGGGNNNTTTILSSYKPVTGVQGGQLVFSDWESVQDLNVLSSTAATTQEVATGPIWASLWVFDPQNNAIPDMVSEVPTAANGDIKKIDDQHMDVTIKLKSGMKWSDGSPITTADLNFTITAICDPDTGAASQVGYDHIASITDTNATTEVWHFGPDPTGKRCGGAMLPTDTGIYAPLLLLNFPPVPQHVLTSVAHKDWATADYFTKKPTATSGPYMVQDFTPGPAAIVTMVPNPNYAAGRSGAPFFNHGPYLDKLIYKIYGDKPSQIAGLKSNDTDLGLDLIAKDLPSLSGINGYVTATATGLLDEYLTLNLGNNETGCASSGFAASCGTATVFKDDKPLRQAVDLAIDKDTINTSLVQGIGKAMNGPFVTALSPYFDTSIAKFQRDVAKANTLLDGDGWVKGSDGTRSKNGRKLAWVISTTAGNSQRAAEEEQLIKNWAEIGASVKTRNWPAGQFFNDFKGGGILATGQYDMGMFANNWSPDPDSWCTTIESSQIPTSANPAGQNWARATDPQLDTLCKQGANEVDITKRVAIYKQLQAEWKDYAPTLQMYERPDVFSHSTNYGNFAPAVNTCLATCNAADWFNTKGKS